MPSTSDIRSIRRQKDADALQERQQARLVREASFNTDLIIRTRRAREASGRTLPELARLLGFVAKETYKRYEETSPLPLYLAEEFCRLTGADLFEFLTGRPNPAGLLNVALTPPTKAQTAPARPSGARSHQGGRPPRK